MNKSDNNKRLAKNTILLYGRMLILLGIRLYTSRIILNALGFTDYGIYNVVGGIVAMFTMVSSSINAAITRFITFELGTGNVEKLKKVFSSSITIQVLLSVILLVLAETVGLWFLNEKMVIPEERMYAANWVYQLSIVTFIVNLISVPYNSAIIAHEKMGAFAYISILEAVFTLTIAWTIIISPFDKLIYYALMLVVSALIIRYIYILYCKRKFEECNYSFVYDKTLFREMFSFSGWNLIGATSAVFRDHGGNLLINLFFGPEVNAARGIGMQVSSAIQGFVTNFQMALNPQITKSYAAGDIEYMNDLAQKGSKFSYYILFLIALPVLVSTEYILNLWLGSFPEHTVSFVQIIIVFTLIESLSGPLITVMYATGEVKNYQIVVGGLQLLNLPISYVFLRLGASPESVIVVSVFLSFTCLIARLIMLKPLVSINIRGFIGNVVFKAFVISVLSFTGVKLTTFFLQEGIVTFVIKTIASLLITSIVILFVGLTKEERKFFISKALSITKKFKHD